MQVLIDRDHRTIFQTSVMTEHGRLEVWLDGLLQWKAGHTSIESPTGSEVLDDPYRSRLQETKDLLTADQRQSALNTPDV